MAFTEWTMKGVEFVNCNCAWGCPCQFNSLPTYGDCCALAFGQIEQGRYGDVPLDGLRWGVLLAWPKAIHLGNGTSRASWTSAPTRASAPLLKRYSRGAIPIRARSSGTCSRPP